MDASGIPALAAAISVVGATGAAWLRTVGSNNRRAGAARDAGEEEAWNPQVYQKYDDPKRNLSKGQFG